jgi:hypothetical protein
MNSLMDKIYIREKSTNLIYELCQVAFQNQAIILKYAVHSVLIENTFIQLQKT